MDRSRYDSALFWLPFGTAAAVIGLALMTIGITRLAPSADVLSSVWFDVGLGLLAIGALMLLWSLWLFLGRRREAARPTDAAGTPPIDPKQARDVEAIRGYFAEREKLFREWRKERRNRR